MNEYQHMMESICVPEEVNDRVLSAACHQKAPVKRAKKRWPVWRMAVCALLAVLLVAGGISLSPRERTMEYNDNGGLETPELYVGLTAKAVGMGENGGVLLEMPAGEKWKILEGTTLALTLTFADGREETGTYHVRTENLKTSVREDGSEILVPVLEGDPAETVSGLYAVPEEGVWFYWPVEGSNTVSLSAPYGRSSLMFTSIPPQVIETRFHAGIDIPAERGTAITAAFSGVVKEAGFDETRGNYLILDHGDGLTTLYGHCQEVQAEEGDTVEAGEPIALIGATGMATGPHLHFEVRQDGEAQNPVAYFNAEIRDTLKMG